MPTFEQGPLYKDNTNTVSLNDLKNEVTGAYITDATVTFTLYDSANAVVSSLSNIAMTYVSGSKARYTGTIPSTATITADAVYRTQITATKSGVGIGVWNPRRVGAERADN